jgi:predicted DNA-binding protein (MmcQ/YjbR family)
MFAACHEADDGGAELPLGFKCSEEDFERLTKKKGIIPAPYAARFLWVSVREAHALSETQAKKLIGESYRLVFEKLPRKVREGMKG